MGKLQRALAEVLAYTYTIAVIAVIVLGLAAVLYFTILGVVTFVSAAVTGESIWPGVVSG